MTIRIEFARLCSIEIPGDFEIIGTGNTDEAAFKGALERVPPKYHTEVMTLYLRQEHGNEEVHEVSL